MTATRPCPACGTPLPADAPAGLCPRCLLAGGLATGPSSPAHGFDPPAVADLAPLFPHLEIIELLGAGGMGAVYKARQTRLDRLVALKVLPHRDDPSFAERFTREARTLAKLNHPGIVHVHDFGQAGGYSFIVMEYVDGVNLRQAVRAGTMTPAEALAVVPQICGALQYAHDAGVVHRDIKPENILLDAKGQVKIADFGLARLLDGGGPDRLTGTHQAMGTPHYMAPEQWERPAAVDHRADIYSLGVVFYELLTGELPLGRFAPPSQKVRVDVRLDDVVLRTLEKEPDRRYQHAGDVKTDVEKITARRDAVPVAVEPPPLAEPVSDPPTFWQAVGLPVLVLIGVWLTAFGLVRNEVHRQNREFAAIRAADPQAPAPEDSAVKEAAVVVLNVVGFLGPVAALVLFIRWLALAVRPQAPGVFWVVTAGLIAVMVLLIPIAAGLMLYLRQASPPVSANVLDDPPRHPPRLTGLWAGDHETIEFRDNGTFENWIKTDFGRPDNQGPAAFTDGRGYLQRGVYRWPDDEHVDLIVAGRPDRRRKVLVEGDALTMVEADGKVYWFKRIVRKPDLLIGRWAQDGGHVIEFKTDGIFEERHLDPRAEPKAAASVYRWLDDDRVRVKFYQFDSAKDFRVDVDQNQLTLTSGDMSMQYHRAR